MLENGRLLSGHAYITLPHMSLSSLYYKQAHFPTSTFCFISDFFEWEVSCRLVSELDLNNCSQSEKAELFKMGGFRLELFKVGSIEPSNLKRMHASLITPPSSSACTSSSQLPSWATLERISTSASLFPTFGPNLRNRTRYRQRGTRSMQNWRG